MLDPDVDCYHKAQIAQATSTTLMCLSSKDTGVKRHTPSPPAKSFPTKSPRFKLSERPPIKFDGHENSHPFKLRVCLSQTP